MQQRRAGAHKELVEFAGEAESAYRSRGCAAKSTLNTINPHDVMTGLIGFSGFHTMMNMTPALLGTQFLPRLLPTDAKLFESISTLAVSARTTVKVDMALIGDIKSTLSARCLPHLEEKTDRQFLDKARNTIAVTRARLDDARRSQAIKPSSGSIWRSGSATLPTTTPFYPVTSERQPWLGALFRMNGKRRLIGSFNHGSMA